VSWEALVALRALRRRADGPPRQEFLFADELKLPGGGWAWIVKVKSKWNEAGDTVDYLPDWERPNHFRSEAAAVARLELRRAQEKRKIDLGFLEFKVEPKWLGKVIQVTDEDWISD
jgi:hypothetical protein